MAKWLVLTLIVKQLTLIVNVSIKEFSHVYPRPGCRAY